MKKILLFVCFAMISVISSAQVISTYPYVEDFEAEATCGTGCGAACATLIDFFNDLGDGGLDWSVDVGGTGSGGTGPSVDHTLGTAAGKYLYVETSCSGTGYPSVTANLESPWFDFSLGLNMQLEFWYHAFGATQGTLNVESRIGMLGAWTNAAGPITDDQDLWQQWSGCLDPSLSGEDSVQFRWSYTSGASFTGDIGLDDIRVSAVNQNDVGVTVITGPSGCGLGTAETISIQVCNFGDTIFSGTSIPVTFIVDGGTPVTENILLTADLLDICNGGGCVSYTFIGTADLSVPGAHTLAAWTSLAGDPVAVNDSMTGGVNSVAVGGALPYFENYEAGQAGWTIDNTVNGTWAYGTPAKNVITGAASGDSAFVTGGLGTGQYNSGENSNVTSPCIDISTATGAEVVTMKVWWNSEFSWDGANLFSSNDGGVSWAQQGAFGDPNNWYTDNSVAGSPNGTQEAWTGRSTSGNGSGGWVCATNALDSAMMVNNGSVMFRVGFGSDGSVNDDGFGFDDFAVGLPITYAALPDSVLGVCDTVTMLDAGPGYAWYHWTNGGTNIYGQVAEFTTTGTWVLTVADSMGMCAKDTVFVEILDFIQPNLMDLTVCPGDSAMFDGGGDNTGGAVYTWSTGDTTQVSWLLASGSITLMKVDTITGCSSMDSLNMFVLAVTLADANLCVGDSVVLDATTTSPNATYMWNTGDSLSMISVSTAGTYGVVITDTTLGCAVSDSMTVVVNALPVVDLGIDMTFCDSVDYTLDAGAGGTYLWNDASTNQTLVVSTTGTYDVVYTDGNGCSGTDAVTVTFVDCAGIDELGNSITVSLYPNPSSGMLTVSIDAQTDASKATMTVVNLFGQTVRELDALGTSTQIDLNDLANGTYFIEVEMGGSVMVKRFVLKK
ncbi:MAG: hypothetical protein ACI865_002433 [Flavobacteriaceae bacterium]|jgi:hypothetical protein